MRLIFAMYELLLRLAQRAKSECRSQLSSLYERASLRVAVSYPRQGETEARKHLRKPDTNRVLWGHSKLWKIV